MGFAFAHKLTSFAMVMCSFLALSLSGELGDIQVLLALIGIITSWYWEPPRIHFERFTLSWTVLSVLVLAYSVFASSTGGDFLVISAEFLIYLLVVKLFNRRTCKDYLHVYILTFLMFVAGTVLNTEFTYGVFFLGYVVTTTWALILFHLRREMEDNFLLKHSDTQTSEQVRVARILNSRRIVGTHFFVGTAAVSLSIFMAAALLFLFIPRIGFGLFFNKNRSGLQMAGFSDGVQLGGHGLIKGDNTVVMRVKVGPEYRGRNAPYVHWRGVAFDRYTKGLWRRTKQAPVTRRTTTYSAGNEQHHLLYDRPELSRAELATRQQNGMRQEIYLEPLGYDVLFGASMPVTYEFPRSFSTKSARQDRNDEMRFHHAAGIKYVVYSDLSGGEPGVERMPRKDLEVYLEVPPEVPQRVAELAREITAGAKTDYERAVALEQ